MMSAPMPEPDLSASVEVDLPAGAETLSEQPAQTETAVPASSVIPAQAGIQPLPVETEAVVELPDLSAVAEKSIAEQITDLQDSIQFLETIWNTDEQIQQEIDSDDWQAFMNAVYQSLTELEQTDIITSDTQEE